MTVLSYQTILRYAREGKSLVTPCFSRSIANGMTYGLGPAGYDIRAAESIILEPGGFGLGSSMEKFSLPNDILAYVKDKSSWARKGICVQNTVLEPGWKGYLTLEYTNHSEHSITISGGDPIAQIVFHRLDEPTIQPYQGKYQNQSAGPQEVIHEEPKHLGIQNWQRISGANDEWIIEMDFNTLQPKYRHKKVGDSSIAWRMGKPDPTVRDAN